MNTLEKIKLEVLRGDFDVSVFVKGAEIVRRPVVDLDTDGDIAVYFSSEPPNYTAYSRKVARG